MIDAKDDFASLREWLRSLGHTDEEIGKIVARVREYDHTTGVDSVMDSIAAGRFDIRNLIREALEP